MLVKCYHLFTWMTSLSCHHRADEYRSSYWTPSVSEKEEILGVLQTLFFPVESLVLKSCSTTYSHLLAKDSHWEPWKLMVSWPAWQKVSSARFLLQLFHWMQFLWFPREFFAVRFHEKFWNCLKNYYHQKCLWIRFFFPLLATLRPIKSIMSYLSRALWSLSISKPTDLL